MFQRINRDGHTFNGINSYAHEFVTDYQVQVDSEHDCNRRVEIAKVDSMSPQSKGT